MNYKESIKEAEKKIISEYLTINLFNYTNTAKQMGVERKTIYNKIISLGIDINQLKLEAASKLMPK